MLQDFSLSRTILDSFLERTLNIIILLAPTKNFISKRDEVDASLIAYLKGLLKPTLGSQALSTALNSSLCKALC